MKCWYYTEAPPKLQLSNIDRDMGSLRLSVALTWVSDGGCSRKYLTPSRCIASLSDGSTSSAWRGKRGILGGAMFAELVEINLDSKIC